MLSSLSQDSPTIPIVQQPDSIPETSSSSLPVFDSVRRPTPHAGKYKGVSEERKAYLRHQLYRDLPLTLDDYEMSDSDNEERSIYTSEEQFNMSEMTSESVPLAKLLLKQDHKTRNLVRRLREDVKSHCVKLILMSIQSTRILLDPLYRRVALMI